MARPTLSPMPKLRRSTAAVAVVFVGALIATTLAAGPAGGQQGERPARVAPAIGPWLGAPRGTITGVIAIDGGVTVEASLVDADSAAAISYAITVDRSSSTSGTSGRPAGFGARVEVSTDVSTDDGLHDICLQVGDARFALRTVDCVRATTAPPNTVSRQAEQRATGALVTPTNIVVPVTGGGPGEWEVTSPCGAAATISEGTFIPRARVVVDPGHGGSEPGAYGGGGFSEKNLNVDVAESLVQQLTDLGISAQITRTHDYRIPIKTRADIATALAPDAFISIHHNGGATRRSSRPGTEVFYATGLPESRRLAAIMYEEMVDTLSGYDAAWVSTVNEGASVRLRDDRMDLYGIHRYSPDITSVISEFVYISNPSEAALMRRDGMAEVEASTIVDSLLRWWWTADAGTTRGREFVDSSSSGTGGFEGCTDPPLTTSRSLEASISRIREDRLVEHAIAPTVSPKTISLLPALQLLADPAMAPAVGLD